MLSTWIVYTFFLIMAAVINRIQPGYISGMGFYIVLVTPAVSFIHLIFTHMVFRVSHDVDCRHISKGSQIIYQIKIENPTRILLAPLSLHYIFAERLFRDVDLQADKKIIVNEHGKVVMNKALVCNYRGIYAVGIDAIYVHDYFKFFRMRYKSIEQHKVLVYPKLRELQSDILRNVANESNESIVARNYQSNSIFSEIREFQPGDSLKNVHWKLSAKRGEWLSKEFSGQMTNNTRVFINTYNLGLHQEETIIYEDYMIEGAVSLIRFLLENRVHINMHYKKNEIKTLEGYDNGDFSRFYNELAHMHFTKDNEFIPMVQKVIEHESDACHVIVMTQIIDLSLAETLVQLKYHNYEVSLIVIDSKELEISGLEKYQDNQSLFMLNTSGIPVYYMVHDEAYTKLEVS